MLTICCVKVGTLYPPVYVNRLAAMVRSHVTIPHEFVCITEDRTGIDNCIVCVDPPDPWPGWWAKVSLFRPRVTRILYFDLDTVLLDNCDFLAAYNGPFAILQDFYRLGHAYGSALMSLAPGNYASHVFESFTWPPPTGLHGDQNWLEEQLPHADLWQEMYPSKIVSYKVHVQKRGAVPPGASIVCFHGHPKQTDLPRGHFLRREWERYA